MWWASPLFCFLLFLSITFYTAEVIIKILQIIFLPSLHIILVCLLLLCSLKVKLAKMSMDQIISLFGIKQWICLMSFFIGECSNKLKESHCLQFWDSFVIILYQKYCLFSYTPPPCLECHRVTSNPLRLTFTFRQEDSALPFFSW